MIDLELTDRILRQGKTLVRAIEALGAIQPSGPFQRALARLLMTATKRRLRSIVPAAPSCVGDQILTASEAIRNKRPAPWLTDNSPKLHRGSKLCRKQ